jgi:uncharacterized protein (DUF305 family)
MDHKPSHETTHSTDHKPAHGGAHAMSYRSLGLMAVLHFAAMFVLMYAMVNTFANALPNINQAYMAGLMTAPMLIFELLLMSSMYPSKAANLGILAAGAVLLIGSFLLIRQQTAVGDTQFLRSMIPHHAGAILVCEKASIRDPEIKHLCAGITSSQQSEIDWMKAKLKSIDR